MFVLIENAWNENDDNASSSVFILIYIFLNKLSILSPAMLQEYNAISGSVKNEQNKKKTPKNLDINLHV